MPPPPKRHTCCPQARRGRCPSRLGPSAARRAQAGTSLQPLLPVSFLHPRSILLYTVLQRLRTEPKAPPGLLKLLARHREYVIPPGGTTAPVPTRSPAHPRAQARRCNPRRANSYANAD